jgi:protocatechuate 3,4-dioxygenase beta subunit
MERKEFIKRLGIASIAFPLVTSCSKDEDVPSTEILAISSFSPMSGEVGNSVIINGSGFSETFSKNIVTFGTTQATILAASTTSLAVTIPIGAETGKISVTVDGKTVTSSNSFTVEESESEDDNPTITSFSPTSGTVGTTVVIVGKNFGDSLAKNSVSINGADAVITIASSIQLTAVVPEGADTTGVISVTAGGKTTNSSSQFTVTSSTSDSKPTITSFTSSGAIGSTIAIIGTNFSETPSENQVTIGGATATVSAATGTQLMVILPEEATSGVITVTVNGSTVTSTTTFTLVAAACVATASETAGPFPTKDPSSLLKQNITGDRTGIPFSTIITLLNKNNDCSALEGAYVDIWHCDKDGYYSEYGGTNMQQVDYTSNHFLRGRQISNSAGMVSFDSIFPGWYQSRATHIHVHIYNASGNSLLVTQIGFPEGTNSAVALVNAASSYGYTKGMSGYTYNNQDNVFTDSQTTEIGVVTGSVESGYAITHTIVLSA